MSVAGLALDLIQPGAGGDMFRNPYDQPPGEGLREALGRVQKEPDPRCLGALDAQRQEALEARPASAEPVAEAEAAIPSDADGPRVQLVCLPGNAEPIALVLRPTSPAAGQARAPARPSVIPAAQVE